MLGNVCKDILSCQTRRLSNSTKYLPMHRWEGTDFGQSRFGHPNLTNFGQSIFGALKGGAPKGWGPERVGPRKGGALKGWGPKFRRLFTKRLSRGESTRPCAIHGGETSPRTRTWESVPQRKLAMVRHMPPVTPDWCRPTNVASTHDVSKAMTELPN